MVTRRTQARCRSSGPVVASAFRPIRRSDSLSALNIPLRQPGLIVLLALVLLCARLGSAHLHLCFDGTAPPASTHYVEDPVAHDGDSAAVGEHQDFEVSLHQEALVKASKSLLGLPLLAVGLLLFLSLPSSRDPRVTHARVHPFLPRAPHCWRPPLRGPPR